VIVTCERCETQFQLDEARVPDQGARVRCSRCKHAFVVYRTAAGVEEEIHRAASEATRIGETPEPTRDLSDPGELSGADWQFNVDDDPDDDPFAVASAVEEPTEPAPRRAEDPEPDLVSDEAALASDELSLEAGSDFGVVGPEDSLSLAGEDDAAVTAASSAAAQTDSLFGDSFEAAPVDEPADAAGDPLGRPGDWDLLDDPKRPSSPPAPPALERRIAAVSVSDAPSEARAEAPASRRRASIRGALPGRGGAAVGWLATVGLLALGLARGLAPVAEAAARPIAAGIAVEELSGRWVDNARLGRIYVVSGALRAGEGAESVPLVLVLRDATGRALDPTLPLSEPASAQTLREGGADALRRRPSWLRRPLRSGETRRFETVVWPLPAEAARFEVAVAGRLP